MWSEDNYFGKPNLNLSFIETAPGGRSSFWSKGKTRGVWHEMQPFDRGMQPNENPVGRTSKG